MIKVFLDTNIIIDIFWKKYVAEKELREILLTLITLLDVVPVDFDVLKKGLRSIHKNFEDARQMICASSIQWINYMVTRNMKDFKTSELVVLTPDEMCLK